MRKLKKFLAELLIACMVFTSVPFTSLATEPQLFNVLPVVDPAKGKIQVATGSAASGSTVSYKTKAAYGYKHLKTNVEVEGASPSEVTGEQYDENTGWTSGEFTMPEANVKIHPYFDKDDIDRYAIEFVNEVGIHYSYRVDAVVDKFNEKAPEGTKKAAAGDEVTIYATSSNLDYKVVDVDIVGKESSNTVGYEQDGGFYTFTMPDEEVLIYVTEEYKEPAEYAITVDRTVENGRIYVESSANSGDTVTFICKPNNGYALDEESVSVEIYNEDRTPIEVYNVLDGVFEFTMPNADVVIYAFFYNKGTNPYKIKDLSTTNCKVYFTKTYAGEGDAIYMDVFPNEDYYIKSVVVSGDDTHNRIDCFAEKYAEDGIYTRYKFIMPAEDVNVRVICEQNPHGAYKITVANDPAKCTVMAPPDANKGQVVNVNVVCNKGWKLETITYNGIYLEGSGEDWYFTMPEENVEIKVTCISTTHYIKVAEFDPVMGGVTVGETAIAGDTVAVNVAPAQGYEVGSVKANGDEIPVTHVVGVDEYTFTMPDKDVEVAVAFVPERDRTFLLKFGSIEKGTAVFKNASDEEIDKSELGKTITVKYVPETGYHLNDADISVKKTIGTVISDVEFTHNAGAKTITFTMPNADVTVAFTCSETDWDVATASVYGHGTIEASCGETAKYQEPVQINAIPETGYHVDSFSVKETVSGIPVEGVEKFEGKDAWQFSMVDAAVTVTVEFAEDEIPSYDVIVETDEAMCYPITIEPKKAGDPVEFGVMCIDGYHVKSVTSQDVDVTWNVSTWHATFTMPAKQVTVNVICEANAHTVTDDTSDLNKTRGTVTITPNGTASFNETVKIACEPKDGYKVESVKVNGEEIPVSQPVIGVDNYTFTMPDKDVTVVVCFALTGKTFDVSFVDFDQTFVKSYSIVDGNGATVVVIDGVAKALPETMLTATLVLAPGCELDGMDVTGVENNGEYGFDGDHNRTWTITFEMPNKDVTFDGYYSTFQWNVYAWVNNDSPSDKKGEATITADLGKDLSGNYIAHYGDTVVLHADYDVDDTAEILVQDINGNTVPASSDEAKKTWTFTMPNSEAFAVETVSPVVHTINADMSQSNGTYVVNFQSLAPAVSAHRGETVFVGTDPDAGYEVAAVIVAKGSGAAITVTEVEANKYSFVVPGDFADPADTIEIAVTFQETIAKICQDAIKALDAPAKALNTISGEAAGVLANVGAAKDQAHTDAKREALKAAGDALQFAKNNVDDMAAVIADLKADSEELRDKTEKTAEDRTAAEGYRNAARIYAGSYTVLVDACNTAITGTEVPLAIVERSVTFNTNGGSEVASQWVVNNSKASKPNAPTKQGYYFVNWYSDASLTNAYDFEMPVDRDITIFAKWNANSSGGSGGSGGSGAPVKAKAPTYSANWYVDAAGTWRIKNSAGQIVASAWLCDDAVAANGQNVWYLLDTDGSMIAAGLVQDATGHFYSIETNHNGYYGMLRYQDGYYDCNGRQVYLQFSRAHDGSFGAIINAEGLAALREIYGVKQFGINNSNCVYTKTF